MSFTTGNQSNDVSKGTFGIDTGSEYIYREQEHERLTEESTEMMQEQNKLLKITLVLTTGRGLGG